MEVIIFIGMQASGKSTFYLSNFYKSHLRINLDMLKTRNREKIIYSACLEAKQSCVIDNTNPGVADRTRYIEPAKKAGFIVIGYYFEPNLEQCIERNSLRLGKEKIPVAALKDTYAKLVAPSLDEGFDQLYSVKVDGKGDFCVTQRQA